MPTDLSRLLTELSRSDLEKLLAAKDEVEELEQRRADLQKELADVEQRLERLSALASGAGRKKAKKKAAKKTAEKKTAKKTTRKKTAKKSAKTKATRKKAGATNGRRGGSSQGTLEDVIVQVLQDRGEPMPFKEILATITSGKLYHSRSKSFDNVLRRTISTSERIKRVDRGVYTA